MSFTDEVSENEWCINCQTYECHPGSKFCEDCLSYENELEDDSVQKCCKNCGLDSQSEFCENCSLKNEKNDNEKNEKIVPLTKQQILNQLKSVNESYRGVGLGLDLCIKMKSVVLENISDKLDKLQEFYDKEEVESYFLEEFEKMYNNIEESIYTFKEKGLESQQNIIIKYVTYACYSCMHVVRAL